MNQDLLDLKDLRNDIIGIEMQIALVETDLITVERDIEYLEGLLEALVDNITTLRKNGIVTIASEYKKTMIELKTVTDNLAYYNMVHKKFTREFDKYKKILSQTIQEYDRLKKQVDSQKVVLVFDTSKRKK